MTLRRMLSAAGKGALDLLLPLECVGCGKEGSALCQECHLSLPRVKPSFCHLCAQPDEGDPCRRCADSPLPIDGIRAPYLMEGTVRQAVHNLKYRNYRALTPELGRLMARYLDSNPVPVTVVAPVPMHPRRLRQRGYNQSALLAREVGRARGLPVAQGLLTRTQNSAPQVSLANREERARNAQGSFACKGHVAGELVLLVDDVSTTGSTLGACAQVLKERGALSVWGLVLAREA